MYMYIYVYIYRYMFIYISMYIKIYWNIYACNAQLYTHKHPHTNTHTHYYIIRHICTISYVHLCQHIVHDVIHFTCRNIDRHRRRDINEYVCKLRHMSVHIHLQLNPRKHRMLTDKNSVKLKNTRTHAHTHGHRHRYSQRKREREMHTHTHTIKPFALLSNCAQRTVPPCLSTYS